MKKLTNKTSSVVSFKSQNGARQDPYIIPPHSTVVVSDMIYTNEIDLNTKVNSGDVTVSNA